MGQIKRRNKKLRIEAEKDARAQKFQQRKQAEQMEKAVEQASQPQLKLVMNRDDQEQVDAFAPIRWCLNAAGMKRVRESSLNRRDSKFYVILAVVNNRTTCETRYVVPLESAMEYVRFTRAGRHTIHAVVIEMVGRALDISEARSTLLELNGPNSYKLRLFNGYGEEREFVPHWIQKYESRPLSMSKYVCESTIDVVIAEELFAKQPAEWLERWVNLWHDAPPVDQCAFRKRMIPAFSIQPPLMLAFFFLKYAAFAPISIAVKLAWAIIAVLMGMRRDDTHGVNWTKVFNPFKGTPENVWTGSLKPNYSYMRNKKSGHCGGSFILYDRDGVKRKERLWARFLTPAMWVIIFIANLLVIAMPRRNFSSQSFVSALKITGASFFFAAMIVGVAYLMFWTITFLAKKWPESSTAPKKPKKEKVVDYEAVRIAEEVAFTKTFGVLTCETTPMEVAVDFLPPERQTFHLRFMRMKAKVCRPFAQG